MEHSRSAVVVGARNLGRAVIERLRAEGWPVWRSRRRPSTPSRPPELSLSALTSRISEREAGVEACLARPGGASFRTATQRQARRAAAPTPEA